MNLNELYNSNPELFQFLLKEFDFSIPKKGDKAIKVELARLNSKRDKSYPFYKPISRIFELKDTQDEI